MNWKNVSAIIAGLLLGLLAAWWLGLLKPQVSFAAQSAATAKPAANPFISSQTTKVNVRMAVEAPVLPPVPASQSDPPTPNPPRTLPAGPGQVATEDLRQQARVKAMKNNLRQLATAASQFMLDKGVRSASYYDLVGDSTDDYIRSINPVMGEDYTGILVSQTDTEVQVVAPDGTTVTYDM